MLSAKPSYIPHLCHIFEAREFERRLRAAIRRKADTRIVCRKLLNTLRSIRRSRFSHTELGPWLAHNRLWIDHNCRPPIPSAEINRRWNEAIVLAMHEQYAAERRLAA